MQNYVNTRLVRNSDFSNMIELSHHPDLTLDVLLKHPNLPWNFNAIMDHPNLHPSWASHFLFQYWDWNKLSQMADLETLNMYPSLFWNWRLVTQKTSMTDMMKYPNIPWDFSALFVRNITSDDIPFFTMFKSRIPMWKWQYFSKNLTWNALKTSIDLPWIWHIEDVQIEMDEFLPEDIWLLRIFGGLCNWINLTINVHINIINDNPDLPWRTDYLHWNKSTWRTPVQTIEKCIREWTAANTIKRHWKNAISNPTYKMCKNRLEKEFKEFEREYIRMSTITFTKLHPDAIIPSKATAGSIGLDLHSVEPYVVLPGQRVVVSTGLRVTLPPDTYGRIAPRSGLAVKHGLDVGAGVVDPDYTGELRVVLFNHDSMNPFIIRPGWRIAQLIVENAVSNLDVQEIPYDDPEDTERGDRGFGSSGN
jgi:dUTP pyrophosphatase